jgi:hypothetical protein
VANWLLLLLLLLAGDNAVVMDDEGGCKSATELNGVRPVEGDASGVAKDAWSMDEKDDEGDGEGIGDVEGEALEVDLAFRTGVETPAAADRL